MVLEAVDGQCQPMGDQGHLVMTGCGGVGICAGRDIDGALVPSDSAQRAHANTAPLGQAHIGLVFLPMGRTQGI